MGEGDGSGGLEEVRWRREGGVEGGGAEMMMWMYLSARLGEYLSPPTT